MIERAVVTGGAGFIGSHLVERLLRDGSFVTVLDSLVTGRLANLSGLPRERLRFLAADIASCDELDRHLDGADAVFHLAALADIVPSIERPEDYHRANVGGTVRLLAAAQAAGVRRFVYAASGTCYGLTQRVPTPESAPIEPQHPYALTKWLGEQYVLHWARLYGLGAASLRLFDVYGPRARASGAYGPVLGVFLAQKLAGAPFTVVGDGTQMLDLTYVSDVVDAFVRCAEGELHGVALNIGSGRPQSVNRLVELLGGETVRLPGRPGEPDRTEADITKARGLLGWEPRVSFEEGVARVLAEIEHWRDAPVWTPETIAEDARARHRALGAAAARAAE